METKDTAVVEEQYEEISLLDLAIIFAKQKWTIIVTTLLFMAAGLVYAFAFAKPPVYKSTLQAMMVAPYVVDQENFSIRRDNGLVEAIVKSEAMKDDIISKFHLLEEAQKKKKNAKRKDFEKIFKDNLEVKTEGQTINISVKAKTPERAQAIADYIFKKTDEVLKEMGVTAVETVNKANDVLLEKEIRDKIAAIDAGNRRDSAKVTELLGMYSAIMARDEGYRLKGKQPLGLQLLSPASYPDAYEPRGRGKTLVLFTMLGFFLGLVLAFMKYVWSTVDESKKQELKAALR